jgi:hypothetical protein
MPLSIAAKGLLSVRLFRADVNLGSSARLLVRVHQKDDRGFLRRIL